MRNLALVAVIFLFAFKESEEYSFGDIISFERKCPCIPVTYKHFAVYVGNEKIDGKTDGQDIFQRTGPVLKFKPLTLSDCKFDKLENEIAPYTTNDKNIVTTENFLDDIPNLKEETTRSKILARINQINGKCGKYNPFFNNCEHVATYVRYGIRISLQDGTVVGEYAKKISSFESKIKEYAQTLLTWTSTMINCASCVATGKK